MIDLYVLCKYVVQLLSVEPGSS